MGDDRHAIEDLLYEYARRVDAGDFEGVGRLFEQGTFRSETAEGLATLTGADEVAGAMGAVVRTYEDGTPRTRHLVTNVTVEIDGDTATATSYFAVLQGVAGELRTVVAGTYEDRFSRVGGAWRFTDRLVVSDLVADVAGHLRADPFRGG